MAGVRADYGCTNRFDRFTLSSDLKAGKKMVDRHPQACIYARRPIGLGRDEMRWVVPDINRKGEKHGVNGGVIMTHRGGRSAVPAD